MELGNRNVVAEYRNDYTLKCTWAPSKSTSFNFATSSSFSICVGTMSLVIAVEALFHCRRQLYSIHCMSSILIDKWDEETKFTSNYNTF